MSTTGPTSAGTCRSCGAEEVTVHQLPPQHFLAMCGGAGCGHATIAFDTSSEPFRRLLLNQIREAPSKIREAPSKLPASCQQAAGPPEEDL
jgi:hypothetical protein